VFFNNGEVIATDAVGIYKRKIEPIAVDIVRFVSTTTWSMCNPGVRAVT